MKLKSIAFATFCLLTASCSNDAIEEPQSAIPESRVTIYSASSVNRTLEEAISIANEAKGMLNGRQTSRGNHTKLV